MSRTAAVLQGLLTTQAEEVGRQCGLIQRQREFTASSLVATFVLGFLRHPQPHWDQLAWVARERGADVTPQAVEQRVGATNAGTVDPFAPLASDSPSRAEWRQRMGTETAQAIDKERASTAECVNALARQRGLTQFRVRGLIKVKLIATWFALAHNVLRWAFFQNSTRLAPSH